MSDFYGSFCGDCDYIPGDTPPVVGLAGRRWIRKRECTDMKCRHPECLMADDEARSAWYDKDRVSSDIFNPHLYFPHSEEWLERRFPFGDKEKEEQYEDQPWPVGLRCMPATAAEAATFIKSNPPLIRFFYKREVADIKTKKRFVKFSHVMCDTKGPCFMTSGNLSTRGMLHWKGWSNIMYLQQLGALMDCLDSLRYTKKIALGKFKASQLCHNPACMAQNHLVWESHRAYMRRGGFPNYCIGFLRIYGHTGLEKSIRLCPHGGPHDRPCILVRNEYLESFFD